MAKLSFDAICQYSEDSIRQCRELAHYFKRRCQHELEFYKTATKNAPVASGSKGKGTVSGSLGTTPLQPANVAEHDSPTQGTSLWSFVDTMCSQYTKTAQLHRVWAIHLATTVLEPLQTDIRGFEVALKAHVERGAGYTKSLQDVYTSLKRAKAVYDGCQSAVIEAGSALQKARQNPNVREKDLEKISQKAVALQEKSQMAADALQVCQDICNVAQEDYYNSLMPSLIEEMRQKEEDRCYAIKRFLTLYNDLEKQFADARMTLHEMSGDQIQQIDIEEDLDVLRKETIAVVHEDRAQDAVSVASLLNPLKSGRMLVKSGEVLASWKNRYFCFMHMERRLYIFDGEDALCPRDVISITNASIHALHPSYFGKPHAFQIIYDSPDKSTRHVANLAAESATETDCWMEHLRKYTYCCATCAASFGYRQETQFNSHLVAGESGFRPVRSFQLMIGEIKDLPTFNVAGLRNVNPYCIILFDDVKHARTLTKTGESCMFGETFHFDNIAPHFARLRILVFHHSRLQRDVEIGYVSINMSALRPDVQKDHWYSIRPFPRPGEELPSSMGSIRLVFTLHQAYLLPVEEYQGFLRLVSQPRLECIQQLGKVVFNKREALARHTVNLFTCLSQEIPGLYVLLREEIMNTDNANIIFRGNSLTTKALDYFLKVAGMQYLHETLMPLIRNIASKFSKEAPEVDPARMEGQAVDTVIKKNWKRLLEQVGLIWDSIYISAATMPRELVKVFYLIRTLILEKYKDERHIYPAISAFLFLRFFCPAILNPKLFDIMADHPEPQVARTLTLIAKILQCLSNGVTFGVKEPYMVEANRFLERNTDRFSMFISKCSIITPEEHLDLIQLQPQIGPIAHIPSSIQPLNTYASARVTAMEVAQTIASPLTRPNQMDLRRELEAMYRIFYQHMTALRELPPSEKVPSELFAHLNSLKAAHDAYDGPLQSTGSPPVPVAAASGSTTTDVTAPSAPLLLSHSSVGPSSTDDLIGKPKGSPLDGKARLHPASDKPPSLSHSVSMPSITIGSGAGSVTSAPDLPDEGSVDDFESILPEITRESTVLSHSSSGRAAPPLKSSIARYGSSPQAASLSGLHPIRERPPLGSAEAPAGSFRLSESPRRSSFQGIQLDLSSGAYAHLDGALGILETTGVWTSQEMEEEDATQGSVMRAWTHHGSHAHAPTPKPSKSGGSVGGSVGASDPARSKARLRFMARGPGNDTATISGDGTHAADFSPRPSRFRNVFGHRDSGKAGGTAAARNAMTSLESMETLFPPTYVPQDAPIAVGSDAVDPMAALAFSMVTRDGAAHAMAPRTEALDSRPADATVAEASGAAASAGISSGSVSWLQSTKSKTKALVSGGVTVAAESGISEASLPADLAASAPASSIGASVPSSAPVSLPASGSVSARLADALGGSMAGSAVQRTRMANLSCASSSNSIYVLAELPPTSQSNSTHDLESSILQNLQQAILPEASLSGPAPDPAPETSEPFASLASGHPFSVTDKVLPAT